MACSCCCYICQAPTPDCCGDEFPRLQGVCCEGVWRVGAGVCCTGIWRTESGTCCDDVWYTASGTCCGDVWYTAEGTCCGNVWYPSGSECSAGEVFVPSLSEELANCCECVPEGDVEGCASICCDATGVYCGDETGCLGSCCVDGACTDTYQADCLGDWNAGLCAVTGCPVACCSEDSDGNPDCNSFSFTAQCSSPSVEGPDCDTACLGACCDGETNLGQKTQSECADLGGCWAGVGSTDCQTTDCRSPFSGICCETKESSGAGLVFTQPRQKRCPPFSDTLRVTATGTTDSPILIHGIPVGREGKRCPFNVTFLLCWDKFNIEPVPCGSNFHRVDVTVCWEQEDTPTETLSFSGCNGLTVWLGNSAYSCTTTLSYVGSGHTSDASIVLLGDAVISASGTGALVLGGTITNSVSGNTTLTLTGTSTAGNQITGIPASGDRDVVKTGTGTWRISGANAYDGQLQVLEGTLVLATAVTSSNSPFGSGSPLSTPPVVGGTLGPASMLADGVDVDRNFSIASGATHTVTVGNTGTGLSVFSGLITLGSNLTLQSSTGGTARFSSNSLTDAAAVEITVGSVGNEGVVAFSSTLSSSITKVTAARGTLNLEAATNRINPATPVVVDDAAIDMRGPAQSLDELTVETELTIKKTNAGTSTFTVTDLSGDGDIIIDGSVTFNINGDNTLAGTVTVNSGSVVVNQIVSGPAIVTSATFTSSTLTVAFSSAPSSSDQFVLLYGPFGSSPTVTLTGAGGATATFDSATSTLTID